MEVILPAFASISITCLFMLKILCFTSMIFFLSGILQGVFWGLGNGGGTMIAGQVYHSYGGVKTFRMFAIMGVVVFVFLCVSNYIMNRLEDNNDKSPDGYEPLAEDAKVAGEENSIE